MKPTWQTLLISALAVAVTFFLLQTSPNWLIYLLATLVALLGIWQVSQVKAELSSDKDLTKHDKKKKWKSLAYWLKRISIFMVVISLVVLSESAWWANTTEVQSSNEKGNTITQAMPTSYLFKKPLWELGFMPLPKLVEISAGEFQMGSDQGQEDEKPAHKVTISQALFMGETEVTFEQYDYYIWDLAQHGIHTISFLDNEGKEQNTKIDYLNDQGWERNNHPAINVSWNEAQGYVNWLSKKTKLQCRLPSEAEWEYAARAGTTTEYSWGDKIGKNNAVCNDCGSKWDNKQTAPVKSFKANDFGLYDMHGNVWEWVQDCYHENYQGSPKDGSVWEDKGCGDSRVLRGGSWISTPNLLRSADRLNGFTPDLQDFNVGFRVVCLPPSAGD